MALTLLEQPDDKPGMEHAFEALGDFQLVQFIGRGGMGEVWLAVKRGSTRPRAIKVLLPELARKDASVESFRREANIGMQLAPHDHIVSVHDIYEAYVGDPLDPERLLYLVLDFVDGVNLGRLADRVYRVGKQRLPIPIVVHIVRAVLRALVDAHGHGIGKSLLPVVHGDIKPGNVLISSRGGVRVTDFGLSRFTPEPTFISRPIGTLPYMAPEQYLGRICPQNDLYAVGALLHELLTGEPPLLEKGSHRTIERKLLNDPPPPLGRDDVPAALDQLRRGLLEKNVALRIQTASQALEILATVDRTDCREDLANIYQRFIGPPRSGLTQYFQAQSDSRGSFVIELLRRHRRPVTAEIPGHEPETTPRPNPPVDAAAGLASHSAASAEAMPWLDEDAEDDRPTTEVRRQSAPRLNPTVRLDLPVGASLPFSVASTPTMPEPPHLGIAPGASPSRDEDLRPTPPDPRGPAPEERPADPFDPSAADSDSTRTAGPLLEPTDGEDMDAVTTAPHRAAKAAKKTTPDPRRFPPRPPHLEDGAPFQLRRPNRGGGKQPPLAGDSDLHPGASVEVPNAGSVTGPATGPHQTRPERSPDTRPDALPVEPPRIPKESTARWLRSAFVVAAAVLAIACGIGLVALALREPQDAFASPNAPHPAITVATSG